MKVLCVRAITPYGNRAEWRVVDDRLAFNSGALSPFSSRTVDNPKQEPYCKGDKGK